MALLELAFEQKADVVLVQEPVLHWPESRKLTKTMQAYNTFKPTQSWQEQPRVMTYIRTELQATSDTEW